MFTLISAPVKDIVMVDRNGAIHSEEIYENEAFTELASVTNPYHKNLLCQST